MARLVILPLQPHLESNRTEVLPYEEAQTKYSDLFPKLKHSHQYETARKKVKLILE